MIVRLMGEGQYRVDEELISALNDLDDAARAEAMGTAGEARARAEFSVAKMVERTLAVYEEALSSRR